MVEGIDRDLMNASLWQGGRPRRVAYLAIGGVDIPGQFLTLRRFLELPKGPKTKSKPPGFRRVTVAAPVERELVVRGPGGISIEGLSLDGVAELLKRLACSV